MDGADEHLGHPWEFTESLACARNDPFLQLGSRLVSESEGDDVPRLERIGFLWGEQVDDTPSNNFGLSGTRAGDQLKVAAIVLNRSALGFGEVHFTSSITESKRLARGYPSS